MVALRVSGLVHGRSESDAQSLEGTSAVSVGSTQPLGYVQVLTPEEKDRVVVNTVQMALARDPGLAALTGPELAQHLGVPPSHLNQAFKDLSDQTGVALTHQDGSARSVGEFLQSVAGAAGSKVLGAWFNALDRDVQLALKGLAAGYVLKTRGIGALANWLPTVVLLNSDGGSGVDASLQVRGNGGGLSAVLRTRAAIGVGNDGSLELGAVLSTDAEPWFLVGFRLALRGGGITANTRITPHDTSVAVNWTSRV